MHFKKLFLLPLLLFSISLCSQNPDRDWSLIECIAYARENNLTLKLAESNAKFEEYTLKKSKWDLAPSVNGEANYNYLFGRSIDPTTYTFQTGSITTSSFGLSGNVILFSGLRKQNTIDYNQLMYQSRIIGTEEVFNDIIMNVIQAYMDVLLFQDQTQIAEYQLSLTNKQLQNTQKLIDAGSLPEGNILEVQAQLANDKLNRITAESQYEMALLNLQLLLNLEPDQAFSIEKPDIDEAEIIAEIPASPENIYQQAVKLMPQIEKARLEMMASDEQVEISRGGYYPTLALYASMNTSFSDARRRLNVVPSGFDTIGLVTGTNDVVIAPGFETQFDPFPFGDQIDENLSQNVGLSLSVPIFNKLQNRLSVQQALINLDAARISFEQQRLQLKTEVYRAYFNAQSAAQKMTAAEENVSAMSQSYEYIQKKYEQGLIKPLDLFLAQNNFQIAQLNAIAAKYELLFLLKILDIYQGKHINLE